MLFGSVDYIFAFLPITLVGYYALNRWHLLCASKLWLICASLVFYSWWSVHNLPIIILSIGVNYVVGRRLIAAKTGGRAVLIGGLAFNLGLLGYYKYLAFAVENINYAIGTDFAILDIKLPLAISFFTLQQIAYLVDAHEGLVPRGNALDYVLFVCFFPQLIIGPIVHHGAMMPQFARVRNKILSLENVAMGMLLFGIGFVKKFMLADGIGPYVNEVFDGDTIWTLGQSWQCALGYTVQLYFDFSGYTDMALGSGLMFNISLPRNFNSPLRASSVIDFWSRWHMTLTAFLTTYIYTPLLMAFRSPSFPASLVAVFATFLICGLWHGAQWNYVLFGAMHGAALTANHLWRRRRLPMPGWLGWLLTFAFITITLAVFRARTLSGAIDLVMGLLGMNGTGLSVWSWQGFLDAPSLDSLAKMLDGTGLNGWAMLIVAGLIAPAVLYKNSTELVAVCRELMKTRL
jgi:alginate O-acetyltransferase complex protein AlgI